MSKGPRHSQESDGALRRRAEEKIRHQSPKLENVSALSIEEARRLVHELEVHQIELEMQNDELRLAQEELTETRKEYVDLYDFAPVGYLTVNEKGIVEKANLTAASLLGVERGRLVGRPFSQFVAPEDEDALYFHRQRMHEGQERETWETRLHRDDGTLFWAQLDCRAVTDTEGSYIGCRSALTDITQRKQVEAEIENLNETLEAAQKMAKVGYWRFDIASQMPTWSDQMFEVCGYRKEDGAPSYEEHKKTWHPEDWESFDRAVQGCAQGTPYNIVVRIRFSDGTYHYVNTQGFPVFDENGAIKELFGTSQDITEYKLLEEELREREERYDLGMKATKDGIYDWNLVTNEIYYSPGWKQMLGYEEDELENDFSVWERLTDPEDIKESWAMLGDHLAGKIDRFELEFKMRHKDGHWVDILSRANAVFDPEGKPIRVVGTHVDITERKQAEENLRYERRLAQQYLDVADVMLIALGIDQRVTLVNPKGCEVLGYSEEEMLGQNWFDKFLPEDNIDEVKRVFDQIISGDVEPVRYFENPIIRKDGRVCTIAWHNSVLRDVSGRISGLFSSGEDITERKQAEEALRESEEKYRRVSDNSPAVLYQFLISPDGTFSFLYVSDMVMTVMGISPEDVMKDSSKLLGMVHPDDQRMFYEGIAKAAETLESFPLILRCMKDGEVIWIEARGMPTPLADGGILWDGFLLDITERKQAEERVRESEAKYRVSFNNSRDAINIFSIEGQILDVNEELTRLSGYSGEELLSMKLMDIYPKASETDSRERIGQMLKEEILPPFETVLLTKEGSRIPVEIAVVPLKDCYSREIVFQGNIRDITERKQVEQELIRLERLRAVGELSAGVSHNLNNILTNVLGPAQLLKRKTDDPEILLEVDDIVTSAVRARDLVHELHQSVRTDGEEPLHPVIVNKVIGEAVQTSRPRWKDEPEAQGTSIEILTHGRGVPPIEGTEVGLHDILTNLIFNAVDAMPEGGTINILTETVENHVEIVFSDTGLGMSEETKLRLFEPFFTTKMDLGTGLGLSTVYRTVTNWGGTIEVDSTLGQGTTFTLRFPVWKEEIVAEKGKAAVESTRSGKILVVDDDEAICGLLSRLLEEQHGVATTTDGQKALEWFAQGKYDVVMIDLGMSGISGDRLMRRLKDIDPMISTVLITGWSLPDTDTRVSSFDFRIVKPFDDLDEVEDVVARAIALHDERVGNIEEGE